MAVVSTPKKASIILKYGADIAAYKVLNLNPNSTFSDYYLMALGVNVFQAPIVTDVVVAIESELIDN